MFRIYQKPRDVLTVWYDSRAEDLALYDPQINVEANCAGSFEFTISDYPNTNLIPRTLWVYRDDETTPIFAGDLKRITTDIYGQHKCYYEGLMARFNEVIMKPRKYEGYTVERLLNAYMYVYNT